MFYGPSDFLNQIKCQVNKLLGLYKKALRCKNIFYVNANIIKNFSKPLHFVPSMYNLLNDMQNYSENYMQYSQQCRELLLMLINKWKILQNNSQTKSSWSDTWIFYYFMYESLKGTYLNIELEIHCKFPKQFMYLKRAPASSDWLFFSVVCPEDLLQQGDAWLGKLYPFLASYKDFSNFDYTKIHFYLLLNWKQEKFVL